jgi:transcriptional regulator with XRE-family HTH domain
MRAAETIRDCRTRAHLSLRALAERAGTSHSALAAYESGRKVPSVDTLDRIVRATGFSLEPTVRRRVGAADPADRGRELVEVLELAAQFPARHARHLEAPVFGRR